MRFAVSLLLVLLLGFAPLAAGAQSTVKSSTGQAATAPAAQSATSPAPTIIPGSPLAAIANATGAQPAPTANKLTPAPFGMGRIGFILSSAVGNDAVRACQHFAAAVHDSIRFTPVTSWLSKYRADARRTKEARAILAALLIGVLPAIFAEGLLRWLLRGVAARLVSWAGAGPDHIPPAPEGGGSPPRPVLSWGRRLSFATLKFLLALVPIAGFALTAFLILNSSAVPLRAATLAATGVSNAYLACRLVQELARFLLSPAVPALALITMPPARARALMRWLLVVLASFLFAAGLVSCALVLGMPHAGITVLIRYAGLALHLEAMAGIWQCRTLVAGWIAGAPGAKNNFTWLRRRLARSWHVIAICYVLALWLAWTAGVHNAFALLLRSVLVLMAALTAGALAWKGSVTLLQRYIATADLSQSRYPNLMARLRVYSPLFGLLIRCAIIVLVALVILQGWGVDALDWLRTNPINQALLSALGSVLSTTASALFLWEVLNFTLSARVARLTETGRARQASRLRTLTPILRGALGTFIFVVALLLGLSQIGVNTTGLLAVSSIAGVAIAFGSQTLVRDIITGLFMLLEDAIQVGDVVTLASMSGTVERLTIRTIYLRGSDGSINIIPFSSVTIITNATRDFSNAELSLTVGFDENLDHVFALLTDIGRDLRADGFWGALIRDDLQIFGLDKFTERGIVITGQIRTVPGQHGAVRREFYKRVQQRFAQEGITIPSPQTTVRLDLPPAETRPSP